MKDVNKWVKVKNIDLINKPILKDNLKGRRTIELIKVLEGMKKGDIFCLDMSYIINPSEREFEMRKYYNIVKTINRGLNIKVKATLRDSKVYITIENIY